MGEIELEITSQTPLNLYGVNNVNLNLIRDHFTKLKIVARGNVLKAIGNERELNAFSNILSTLIEMSVTKSLTEEMIEEALQGDVGNLDADMGNILLYGIKGNPIKVHSPNQKELADSIEKHDLILAVGPAGTGKTYTSVALAVKALKEKQVKRIILTRPAVEAGENLGFLPGDLKEKMDPYLQPLYDALHEMIPREKLNDLIDSNVIQIAPLAYMRGRTLDKAFVILDEAQNATESQFKMFVTRMGKNAKFIVTGDVTQIDLPYKSKSGLVQAIKLFDQIKGIDIIEFDESDVMRHAIVKRIIKAYGKTK